MPEHSARLEHPNAVLAQRAWEAVARSDIENLREFFSDDVVWHATGRNPWAGDHRGFDAILDYLAQVGERTDRFDARVDDILVSDSRVLIVFRVEAKMATHTLDIDYSLLARVAKGICTEVWTAPLDPVAIDRFWRSD